MGGKSDSPFTDAGFIDTEKISGGGEFSGYMPGSASDGFGIKNVNKAPIVAQYFGEETDAQRKRREEEERKRQETQDLLAGQLPKYAEADTKYADTYKQNTADIKKLMDEYLANFQNTMQGAIGNVNQAQQSYYDTWLGSGGMKDQMTANAKSALTLEELMDPDNKVAQAFRESYERDAQAARQQGQQDYGILSALGAQAAQGQFGMSGPMTAGAMGQIYAQNQNQAGEAYARAQQRMYDLQQQGRKAGEDQTASAYKAGQEAIAALLKGEQDYGASQSQLSSTAGQLAGLLKTGSDATQQYYTGREDELAGITHANTTNQLNREGGLATGNYDWLTQMHEKAAGKEAADQASRNQLLAVLATLAAGGAGGAAAGAGAAAASKAASSKESSSKAAS